ncbi:MAG: hypothetical protein JXR76_11350 [Deltaproteobacteria bacterium]|nr:hypothetical protein [Deltaproteobacteria bacterium]
MIHLDTRWCIEGAVSEYEIDDFHGYKSVAVDLEEFVTFVARRLLPAEGLAQTVEIQLVHGDILVLEEYKCPLVLHRIKLEGLMTIYENLCGWTTEIDVGYVEFYQSKLMQYLREFAGNVHLPNSFEELAVTKDRKKLIVILPKEDWDYERINKNIQRFLEKTDNISDSISIISRSDFKNHGIGIANVAYVDVQLGCELLEIIQNKGDAYEAFIDDFQTYLRPLGLRLKVVKRVKIEWEKCDHFGLKIS